MSEGRYLLTAENYEEEFEKEYEFFTSFEFESVNGQEDYEADYYAGALLNHELTGADPISVADGSYGETIIDIETDKGYRYLCFDGQKTKEDGRMELYIYDENGDVIVSEEIDGLELDNEMHQFAICLPDAGKNIKAVLKGDTDDVHASGDNGFRFSNIRLY